MSLSWVSKGLHAYRNDLLAELILLVPEDIAVPVGFTVDLVVVFSATVESDQVVTIDVSDPGVLSAPTSVAVFTGESMVDVPVQVIGSGIATVTATHATGNGVSTISTHPHTSIDTLTPSVMVAESAIASVRATAPEGDPTGDPPTLPTPPLRPTIVATESDVSMAKAKAPEGDPTGDPPTLPTVPLRPAVVVIATKKTKIPPGE